MGDKRKSNNDGEYYIKPNIQAYFTDTKFTTKHKDDEDKLTLFIILNNIGFYSTKHHKRLNSARLKDAL